MFTEKELIVVSRENQGNDKNKKGNRYQGQKKKNEWKGGRKERLKKEKEKKERK